jgi:fructose transport system substrate-binding protein
VSTAVARSAAEQGSTLPGHAAIRRCVPNGAKGVTRCSTTQPAEDLIPRARQRATPAAPPALGARLSASLAWLRSRSPDAARERRPTEGGASAAQFPGKMAAEGVEEIYRLVKEHVRPATSPGLGFNSTGTGLYTDEPQAGVPSLDTLEAKQICWGQ